MYTAALPWPRVPSFLPGAGGTKDREGWWWWWRAGKQTMRLKRQKSIGNEASLVWLPVGRLVSWFIPFFFPLSSWVLLKIIFLPMMLSRKRLQRSLQNSWQYHLYAEQGGIANKLFCMFFFNLADVFSVNYEPNSPFRWFNKCVDIDNPNPTFPGQEHISSETNGACRPPSLFSHKRWSHRF